MIAGLLASMVMAAAAAPAVPATQDDPAAILIEDARSRLLNGDPLPVDIDTSLRRLPPAQRLRVLVFLRRSGMLETPGWTVEQLLAPMSEPQE